MNSLSPQKIVYEANPYFFCFPWFPILTQTSQFLEGNYSEAFRSIFASERCKCLSYDFQFGSNLNDTGYRYNKIFSDFFSGLPWPPPHRIKQFEKGPPSPR
jgi:hypothetical protein